MILLSLRLLICLLMMIVFFFYGLILVLIFPFNPRITQHLGSFIGTFGSRIMGMEVEIRGHENFKKHHQCIYISNHQSNYDLFVIGRQQPYRAVSVGKKSLVWVPLFGIIYWLSGNILIDRKNKRSAWKTMEEAGSIMDKRNASVYVMPEGTRSRGKGLAKFKKGAFAIAIATKKPIVPIVISSYAHFDFKKLRPGKIIMQAFSPIETKDFTSDDVAKLTDQCHQFYQRNLPKLDEEIRSS